MAEDYFKDIKVPTWPEIKAYFTDTDRAHMLQHTGGSLDLHKCSSVLSNAAQIYAQVSAGTMPPGAPWKKDKIQGFYTWWQSDPTCP